MPHGYPILLELAGRRIVIVGGGKVAARKAAGVLAGGARDVRAVAPEFVEDFPQGVERVAERYDPRHLEGAGLVFAATDDPAVNARVVRDARRLGILVNRADVDEQAPGDFTVPAVLRRGEVVVGVSAGGSAALAAGIRDDIAGQLDPRRVAMAEALSRLRPMIRDDKRIAPQRRRVLLRELAGADAMAVLGEGGLDALKRWIVQRYPELSQ